MFSNFFEIQKNAAKKNRDTKKRSQKKSRYKKTQPKKIEIQKNAAKKNRDTKKRSQKKSRYKKIFINNTQKGDLNHLLTQHSSPLFRHHFFGDFLAQKW